ncbi:MAG: hypothetical protein AAB780_01080 [Patescibacteria group bacterium]
MNNSELNDKELDQEIDSARVRIDREMRELRDLVKLREDRKLKKQSLPKTLTA